MFSAWLDITDHGALLTNPSLSSPAVAVAAAVPPTSMLIEHYGFDIIQNS